MQISKVICLSVLAAAVGSLAGCVTPPDLSETDVTCAVDPSNLKPHEITYGVKNKKTALEVKEKVEVKQNTALVFKLKPKGSNKNGVNYDDVYVTVVGKTATDQVWLNSKKAKGDDSLIAYCAPSVDADTTYEYEVHVDGLGMLDPRVDVKQ